MRHMKPLQQAILRQKKGIKNKNKHIDINLSSLPVKTNFRKFMQDVEWVIIIMWFSNTC